MSKKDYELIARVLRSVYTLNISNKDTIEIIVKYLCIDLKYNNPMFDQKRFEKAVYEENGG